MKTHFWLASLVLAPLLGACANAPTAEQRAEAMTGPDGEPVICRKMPVTGTRFPIKECKTEAAWAEYDEYTNSNAKESTDKFQRLNSGCSTQAQGSC